MILDKSSLKGKTAIVTGVKKVIGQFYTIALAEIGADIIISASCEQDFSETEKWITDRGSKFKRYVCDFLSNNAIATKNTFLSANNNYNQKLSCGYQLLKMNYRYICAIKINRGNCDNFL